MECYLIRSKLPSGIRIADVINIGIQSKLLRAVRTEYVESRVFSRNDINDDHKHTKTTREITFSAFAALAVLRPQKSKAAKDRADRRVSHPETEHDNDEKLPMLSFIVDCSPCLWVCGLRGWSDSDVDMTATLRRQPRRDLSADHARQRPSDAT